MHFQNHRELGRIIASERVRQASRVYHLATVQTARLEQRKTAEHFHRAAEEIYLFTHGRLS